MDRLFAKRNGLPPVRAMSTTAVRIPLRDAATLGADLFTPVGESKGLVLTMGPYGRVMTASSMARVYAGQSYTVLLVSSRGTADSGGEFDPMVQRISDQVLEWSADLFCDLLVHFGFAADDGEANTLTDVVTIVADQAL